jgi:hypothetical protein
MAKRETRGWSVMTGSRDLSHLLRNIEPKLKEGEFVFCSVSEAENLRDEAIMVYREDEGLTLILRKKTADERDLAYDGVWQLVTLNVHSDLAAVGFLAAISKELASHGISCNVVSAFYHDHIYVPHGEGHEVVRILDSLSERDDNLI